MCIVAGSVGLRPGGGAPSPLERPMANPLVEALEKVVQHAWDLDIPLNEKLTIVANEVRSLSTVFAEAVDRMVIRLQNTGAGDTAPGVGEAMPPFRSEKLTIVANEVRSLSTVFAEAVDRMVIRLQNTGAGDTAPGVGEAMPPF